MAAINFYQAMLLSPLVATFNGAYDSIPNMRVAYGLRRMKGSYTGALLRIKRNSDNLETDIGYLTNGDLNYSAITAFAPTGHNVTRLYDQTGGDNHADNFTTYATVEALNGKYCIRVKDISLDGGAANHGFTIPLAAANMASGEARVQMNYCQSGDLGAGNYTNGGGYRITAASTNLRSHHPWSDGIFYDTFYAYDRQQKYYGVGSISTFGTLSVRASGGTLYYWINNTYQGAIAAAQLTTGVNQAYFPDAAYGGALIGDFVLFDQGGTNPEQSTVDLIQMSYYGIT